MRILCVTDQTAGSRHSSIEGIFHGALPECCEVYTVFFSRDLVDAAIDDHRLSIPYRYKKRGAAKFINRHLDLGGFDLVIVRNLFPVLRTFLEIRSGYRFRLGFWNSFPHSFRRYFEAQQERRALLRKWLEYRLRNYLETKLVARCDFLIVMSHEFKESFFPGVDIPYHPLPMGFTLEGVPAPVPEETASSAKKRLLYIGTVDNLRRVDLIIEALTELEDEFVLDLYTQSRNEVVSRIGRLGDPRIRLCPALPRPELFRRMAGYDAGIGLIPENALYNVSSPTKTVEYYAVGLPALVNFLPEYRALFDGDSAFFCEFTKEGIKRGVREILEADREQLAAMGQRGKRKIEETRNYAVLSSDLFAFLRSLPGLAGSADPCSPAAPIKLQENQ